MNKKQANPWWTRSLLLIALAAPHAQAQGPDAAARPAASVQTIEQKISMVDRVLNQSPVAARVATSQSDPARKHLANARELVTHARKLVSASQLRAADALMNEAIYEISRAQQLVPDPGTQQATERARYAQLEDSVSALRRTALVALPQAQARLGDASERANTRANALVEQATALARADRYIEANKLLDQATVLLLRDASQRLAGQTIVYDRKFANREEEFAFELERHRSFERLVPLALVEFRPSAEAKLLVERYVIQARDQREWGESVLARDPIAAIKSVTDGTDTLRRALQAAGLNVPQTMGEE